MPKNTQKIHLLIAAGESMLQRILSHVLKDAGYLVTTAENGLEALYIFNTFQGTQKSFDLILFDLSLSKISSFELVKRLEKQALHIPIVIISPSDTKTVRHHFPENMHIQIVKTPFFKEELIEVIEKVIEKNTVVKKIKK